MGTAIVLMGDQMNWNNIAGGLEKMMIYSLNAVGFYRIGINCFQVFEAGTLCVYVGLNATTYQIKYNYKIFFSF